MEKLVKQRTLYQSYKWKQINQTCKFRRIRKIKNSRRSGKKPRLGKHLHKQQLLLSQLKSSRLIGPMKLQSSSAIRIIFLTILLNLEMPRKFIHNSKISKIIIKIFHKTHKLPLLSPLNPLKICLILMQSKLYKKQSLSLKLLSSSYYLLQTHH